MDTDSSSDDDAEKSNDVVMPDNLSDSFFLPVPTVYVNDASGTCVALAADIKQAKDEKNGVPSPRVASAADEKLSPDAAKIKREKAMKRLAEMVAKHKAKKKASN